MNINLKVVVFLVSIAAAGLGIILGISVGSDDLLTPSLAAGAFVALFLISKPKIAAACAVATFFSGVTLPGLPGQMRLFEIFALALIGIFLLQATLRKANDRQIRFSRLEWVLLAFCAWIFFIGLYRGFGFFAFGGDMIGGFSYVRLLLTASIVITLPRIGLPTGGLRSVFVVLAFLAPASLLADLLVMKGWDFSFVHLFIQSSQSEAALENAADIDSDGLNRLWSAGQAATGMLIALLALVPMRKFFQKQGLFWLLIFAGIVTLSLLSGFRMMTFCLIVITALTLYFQKGLTAPRMAALFVTACVSLAFIYGFSSQFPNSVQRAVSWLPGIDVSSVASGDATSTVEWRVRLWKEALRYLPDYWLIGKGFAYDKLEYIYSLQSSDDLRWGLVTGSYHNGWLSMLLCTGVIGSILCLILLIAPLIRHWKRQRAGWNNPFFQRLHGVCLAGLAITVATYFIIYGEVHTSFPTIFFYWALMEALSREDADETPEISDESFEPFESVYQES